MGPCCPKTEICTWGIIALNRYRHRLSFNSSLPCFNNHIHTYRPSYKTHARIQPFPNHLYLASPSPKKPRKMSQAAAQKRLLVEYKNLTNDPPDGITAGPSSEDDMFVWEALVQGPEGTPFEGGIFPAELKFPRDYPLSPPTMRFTCELWHPNGEFGFFGWLKGKRKAV